MANEANGKSMKHAPVVVGTAGAVQVAEIRQRIDELVAMGYEQMLQERLVSGQSSHNKARLKFLLL